MAATTGDDMGRHSFRGVADDGDEDERPIARGRHALDDRDEVFVWEWPAEDPDELGDEGPDAPTEVLAIRPGWDQAEDDTVPKLDLREGWAMLGEPWPEQSPGDMPRHGPRHSRNSTPEP
ncbi:MAG: hypothetical protein ACRDQ5_16370 [Sciscionella sp.]